MFKTKISIYFISTLFTMSIAACGGATAQSFEVTPLKIGKSSEQVFASDFFNGELYFCSNAKSKHAKNIVNEDNTRFLNLYRISLNTELELSKKAKPTLLPSTVNSELNEGPIFFNKNTGEAFFSSNQVSDSTQIALLLFKTKLDHSTGIFENRELINLDLGDGNYSNPTISENGQLMVFSFTALTDTNSNLYVSKFVDNKWSKPAALKDLNSEFNETFPRLFKNTLYFVSDRPNGIGGLDIYKCSFQEGETGQPSLLPEPVNSTADDFLFFKISDNKGFFSSNRNQGTDRIFSFEQDLPSASQFYQSDINFCYTMQDEILLDKQQYDYVWDLGDGSKKNGAIVNHCYSDTGVYEIKCHLLDIQTLEVEENILEGKVAVYADLPLIKTQQYAGIKTIYLEQKWSRKNFTNFYWIHNDNIVTEEQITISSNHSKPIVIKVVLWNIDNPEEAIGITKTITPEE